MPKRNAKVLASNGDLDISDAILAKENIQIMTYFSKLMGSVANPSYALFRMVLGFFFMWHGTQKLFDIPVDFPYELNALSQAAGIIELVGGVLVLLGCITRPVAFICSGTMAVAYWMVHGLNSFFPMINGGELAALYCFGFLLIAANGPGIWSVDNFFSKNSGEENS